MWFVHCRSCGNSRMRSQSYRRFATSRSKPSRKWDCISASKNPLSPHEESHQPAHHMLKPSTCVLMSEEGESEREACQLFRGDTPQEVRPQRQC